MHDPASNLSHLSESPYDWEIRITAIEDFVRIDDMDSARRLVRESPDDSPVPDHLKLHLHTLLTKGKDALPPLEDESVEEVLSEEVLSEEVLSEEVPSEEVNNKDAEENYSPSAAEPAKTFEELTEGSKADSDSVSMSLLEEEKKTETKEEELPSKMETSLSGGLAALMEADEIPEKEKEAPLPKLEAIRVDREAARKRWEEYDGDLNLTVADQHGASVRRSSIPERFSALTLAAVFHLVLFILVSLVAINSPRPKPPQLILSVPHEREVLLTTTRITRQTKEMKPSAASAQAVNVLSSVANSDFKLPEIEDTDNYNVTSMIAGLQPTGQGMSFSTQAVKESDVNFFGISGGGKKIVFVIDATPAMLVDEKGGMTAYDKVKNEVSIMLANLNRGTHFNILIYQGKKLVAFREKPVPGLPSNLRKAIEWMGPLNKDYEALGLRNEFGPSITVADVEGLPILAVDNAFYTKAIQKALEWRVSAVFCISNGYGQMNRSLTPEMRKKMAENPETPGTPGKINPAEAKAWRDAVAKTKAWLQKENAARREKGISPKVVTNFNALVRQITGKTQPRQTGGTPATGGAKIKRPLPVTPKEIEEQVKQLVKLNYKEESREEPSVHMVLFLGEDEEIGDREDHFKDLTRKNRGKLKILKGLAALSDVTAE